MAAPPKTPNFNSEDRLNEFIASPRKAVWTMAIPMMAGMAVHTLYLVADTAFIGTLGTEALAAATFVGPLFFVIVTLTMGFATAVTALIAQAIGRREHGAGDRIAGTALSVGFIIGVLLTLVGLASGPGVLRLLGASGETVDLGWQYFEIITFIVPLFFVSSTLRSVLTGEGDARTPTLIMTISTVINLGFDALFIFVLGLGLRGAALATAAAQVFSLISFIIIIARRRKATVRFRLAALMPTPKVLWKLTALAAPTSAGMMVMSIGGMALNKVLSEFGEVAVAAYGAASKVDLIVGMPVFGLAGASVTVIGMFSGAGRIDIVRSTAIYVYRWALTISLIVGTGAYLASDHILLIFTRDAETLEIGHIYLGFMIFVYPSMAIGMTTGRLLQGLGHGVPSLIITSVRLLFVAIPAYISVYVYDGPIWSVWASILTATLCSTFIAISWVRRLVWSQDPTAYASA